MSFKLGEIAKYNGCDCMVGHYRFAAARFSEHNKFKKEEK